MCSRMQSCILHIVSYCRITVPDGGAAALAVPVLVLKVAWKSWCRIIKICSLLAALRESGDRVDVEWDS